MKPKFDYENFVLDTYLRYVKYLARKKKRRKKHDSKRGIRRD